MQTIEKTKKYYFYTKDNSNLLLNYLFIPYVFFLPLTGPTSTVFFLMLALFFIRGNIKQHITAALSNKVIFAFFLLFAMSVLWLLGTDDLTNVSVEMKRMKIYLFPIVFISFLKPEFIPKAIIAFMLGMLASEITSYAIFFHIIEPIFYKNYAEFDPSPFMHHSEYGLILALSAGILFYRLIAYKDELYLRITTLLFFITITVNIFITGGRMGYVLYGVSIFIVLAMYKVKLYKIILITVLLSVTVFSLAYQFSPLFQKRFHNSVNAINKLNTDHPFNSSFGTRLGFIYYAIPVIKDNLLFGVGTGDHMEPVYNEIKKHKVDTFLLNVTHFHNAHLVILVQFGLLGLFVWLNVFYQSLKFKQTDHFMHTLMVLSTVLLFFYSFMSSVFKTQIAEILAVLITLSLIHLKTNQFKNVVFSKNELVFYAFSIPLFIAIKTVS